MRKGYPKRKVFKPYLRPHRLSITMLGNQQAYQATLKLRENDYNATQYLQTVMLEVDADSEEEAYWVMYTAFDNSGVDTPRRQDVSFTVPDEDLLQLQANLQWLNDNPEEDPL